MAFVLFSFFLILSCIASANSWPTGAPFWPHYPSRTIHVLDGEWSFGYAPNSVDPVTCPVPSPSQTPITTTVPSCFDVQAPGIQGFRGTAYYRTSVVVTPNTAGFLYFGACSFFCRVFVDNVELLPKAGGHRAGGYQPFWFSVDSSPVSKREIAVVVNNQYNETTAPTHTGGDFYEFGGITRSVLFHELPASANSLLRLEPFTREDLKSIFLRVVFRSSSKLTPLPAKAKIRLTWDNRPNSQNTHEVEIQNHPSDYHPQEHIGATQISHVAVPDAKIWDFTSARPHLHVLRVDLLSDDGKSVIDSIETRLGLRVVGTARSHNGVTRLTINNKVVKLPGVNRHTMWPDMGSALTLAQVQKDLTLLNELGVKYVRGAHYPQDPRFLDLCDEQGIVVWEETLGPGVELSNLQSKYWMDHQIQAVNEMIDASIAHPSVILHGFFNEGPSDQPAACSGYNASAGAIRDRFKFVGGAPSRLVTYASDKANQDVCLPVVDVVSFNSYPGWYQPAETPKIFWAQLANWSTTVYPTKPFLISETGGGGVYEWKNATAVKWSQLFEATLVGEDIKIALSDENISGLTIWQFNDIKANQDATAQCGQCEYLPHPQTLAFPWDCAYIDVNCSRPGGENHKGQVDFWRRKKESFFVMQKLYRSVLN